MHDHHARVCEFIDLEEERHYWRALFSSQSSVMRLGSFADCWPLVVLGYSRYLTHIRLGEDAFFEAFLRASAASSAHWCNSDTYYLLVILKQRITQLADQQQPRDRNLNRRAKEGPGDRRPPGTAASA